MAVVTVSDPTFRAYKGTQAKRYDEGRPAYTPALYEAILRYHDDNGGHRGTVIDVGCGPGRATRELARFFDNAIGVDPSENMIDTAKQVGGAGNTGKPIEYYVSPAEKIADLEELPDGKVDILTAAAAAHWFDMPKFWGQAARLLRPGGSVALWTTGCFFSHPASDNAGELNRIMRQLETDELEQFELTPNVLSRTLYDDLALPWKLESPQPDFEESAYVRREWDRDGVLTDGEDFFGDSLEISLDMLEKGYDTASTVTRWRAANPELAYGPHDCVKRTIAQLRKAVGPESNGLIRGSTSTVLLLFKRR
ncbi:methyltransferase type 11 domain-containing protein [Colletotrichum kahawae]|uniref:Methyltransferase type 11 domain-containing protein n=1 Tax=Colletotrichum kahawae TaxID=34407 RepID=A0AAD9Y829_COLKA|nr:methyltransferase type 11 domain-containing protein [Colletotrichum kahawae]